MNSKIKNKNNFFFHLPVRESVEMIDENISSLNNGAKKA